MDLQVPQSQRKTLQMLLALDSGTLNAVIVALRTIQPSMSLGDCAETVARNAKIEEVHAGRILVMLAGLFGVRDRPAAAGEDIVEKLLAAVDADLELKASESQRQRLHDFLAQALALEDSVGITSKAWSVTREYERTYCSSRTLTDLRPVFKLSSEGPAAFLVMHNLRITFHEGDKMNEFFVALRTKDLEELKAVIDRAATKGQQLRRIAARLEAPVVEVE